MIFKNTPDAYIDYFDDNDRADEHKLHTYLLKFAAENGLIIDKDGTPYIHTGDNTLNWKWALTTKSFRRLVDMHEYGEFINSLSNDNNASLSKVLDLHARLGMLFNPKLLNTIVDRVFQSIQLIPYIVPEDNEQVGWETIHAETPFIWILILLQNLLHSEIGLIYKG